MKYFYHQCHGIFTCYVSLPAYLKRNIWYIGYLQFYFHRSFYNPQALIPGHFVNVSPLLCEILLVQDAHLGKVRERISRIE